MTITVALLGGGNILLKICEWLSRQEYVSRVDLIAAPRHSEEILSESGMRFYDRATEISKQANNGVHASFLVVDTLDDSSVAPILSSSDIAFSISAAWIFKKRHIDLCHNLINIHGAMLPQWRGGGGCEGKKEGHSFL